MKLEKVKSAINGILESKEESLANPVEPIETKVDVVDVETAEEDTEKINKEINKRIKEAEKIALQVKGEDHVEEPKLVKESKEFKKEERKELGDFIHELKEKKIKHIVKRSVNEGYRYLVEFLNPVKEDDEVVYVVTELGNDMGTFDSEDEAIKFAKEHNHQQVEKRFKDDLDGDYDVVWSNEKFESLKEGAKKPFKYEISYVDSDGHEVKGQMFTAENVSGHLKNLEDWGCTKIVVKSAEEIKESKLDEMDVDGPSTTKVQIEAKPEVELNPDEDKEEKEVIVVKSEDELEEGAEGKKEPGKEFVVFDASVDGKAPILGIRSTRVEAEWLMNRLMKTGKYDNVSFDEAPKGKFHKGDDFWGPFDDNWEKMESVEEKHVCPKCGKEPCECKEEVVKEAIDTSKEVWEGWTVQDFIDELEPSFEQIMRGESYQRPFANKEALKKWCMSEQPYYKKFIPEVVEYFDSKVRQFGGYGKFAECKEELHEEESHENYGDKAWLLNEILSSFNNEGAYYSTGWLYIWPDGCSKEDCEYYFGSKEEFEDLEDSFKRIYKSNYRKDGFYRKPSEAALELAHKYDEEMGLPAMEILGESLEEEKKDVHGLYLTVRDKDGKIVKAEQRIEVGTKEEMEEMKKHLEEVSPEDASGNKNEYVVRQIRNPKKEDLNESFEEIYIKYWEDEELRDQGISEIYRDDFATREEAIEVARKLVDRDGFASVEVFVSPSGKIESESDKLIWGYDGVETWDGSGKPKKVVEDVELDADDDIEIDSEEEVSEEEPKEKSEEDVSFTVDEVKDIASDVAQKLSEPAEDEEAAEEQEEDIEETVEEVVSDAVEEKTDEESDEDEDEDDISWLTSTSMDGFEGEKEDAGEEDTEEVIAKEDDIDEDLNISEDDDDISWIK